MCGINAVGAQGSGCMFTLCHAPRKMAVLLHKTENVCRVMNTAVCRRKVGVPSGIKPQVQAVGFGRIPMLIKGT